MSQVIFFTCSHVNSELNVEVSAQGHTSLLKSEKIESGQMLLEKHRHRRKVTSHHFFDYYDFNYRGSGQLRETSAGSKAGEAGRAATTGPRSTSRPRECSRGMAGVQLQW